MTVAVTKTRKDMRLTADGMLRVDGIPIGKVFCCDGVIVLQFCDGDRMRSNCRGSRLVEVALSDFLEVVELARTVVDKT